MTAKNGIQTSFEASRYIQALSSEHLIEVKHATGRVITKELPAELVNEGAIRGALNERIKNEADKYAADIMSIVQEDSAVINFDLIKEAVSLVRVFESDPALAHVRNDVMVRVMNDMHIA